jgi:hypothetical protein
VARKIREFMCQKPDCTTIMRSEHKSGFCEQHRPRVSCGWHGLTCNRARARQLGSLYCAKHARELRARARME